jgi:oxygen-independent coproporphyrinogen-3 oxidase
MPQPLLVYVHVPFCSSKCHFCDWVQQIPPRELRRASTSAPRLQYLDGLISQIETLGPQLVDAGYVPAILYWGGGTASILTEREIKLIMGALSSVFDFGELVEATIECSPETLTPAKLELFRALGFSRISIGLQSTDDERLRAIGRAHDARTGAAAVRAARAAGFEEINIDLISGFPGETLTEFERSLVTALELPIDHVSMYPYRPSAGTVMRRQLRSGVHGRVDLEEQLNAYAHGREQLTGAGLPEYAMSHFGTRPCHSDLAYFQLKMDWVGFGSGATSLLAGTFRSTARGHLERYSSDPMGIDESYPAASDRIAPRLLHQSLSTWEGANARLWRERTGVELSTILRQPGVSALLRSLETLAPVTADEEGIRLSADDIAEAFIRLLHASAPRDGRSAPAPEALLGAY